MPFTAHTGRFASTLLLSLIAAGYHPDGNAAPSTMYFQQLALEDGLSQNTVLCMLQDSQGFIWIGTENGLNRFDGRTIKRYLHDPKNPKSLSSDYIWDITEGQDGNIWIATSTGGVQQWQRSSDTFLDVDINAGTPAAPLGVGSVEAHPDGSIWIGTLEDGLFRIKPDGGLSAVRDLPAGPNNVFRGPIQNIQIDSDGRALVSTVAGPYVVRPSGAAAGSDNLVATEFEVRRSPDRPSTKATVAFDEEKWWIASRAQGVQLFEVTDDNSPRLVRDYSPKLQGSSAQTILRDSRGRIWVGTHTGLLLFDPLADRFVRYTNVPGDPHSLASNYVVSLYEDRNGVIWVGTRGGGVSRWNPRTWSLGAVEHAALDGAVVNAFAPKEDGQTWIGTIGSGLILHDESAGAFTRFTRSNGFDDLPDQRIMSLLVSSVGDLWIGTQRAGLFKYEHGEEPLQQFRQAPGPDGLGANGIMALHESKDGMVWAGTFGGGMASIDPNSNKVTQYSFDASDGQGLPSSRVTAFADANDDTGDLWIGTLRGGVAKLDRQSGQFSRLDSLSNGLSGSTIYALHVADNGDLFVGTAGGGLVRVRGLPDAPVADSWSTPQGFSSNVIYGIQPDAEGQLWLSSNDGLIRFDPKTGAVELFHRSHGLHSDEFNFNAHARRADGKLYFGGSGGFNAFHPLAVERNRRPPQLALTSLELFNEPAKLATPYPQLSEIELDHRDDVITFEFAALDFAAPESNLFSYQLDGFDRNWSLPSTRQRATYTNLDSGNYTFRVRAANSDGAWTAEDQELRIDVRVEPSPWASWWAYTAYFLILGSLVFGFVNFRIRRAEAAAQVRQLTFYDRVTGLPNRELLEQRLTTALADSQPEDDDLLVVCLQAFGLSETADVLGVGVANNVMTTLASRISRALSTEAAAAGEASLGRASEQTFVLLLRGEDAVSSGMRIGNVLLEVASHAVSTPTQDVSLDAAVGVAAYTHDDISASELISHAVVASGEAREHATRIAVYEDVMSVRARDRIALERDLALAIENNSLALYIQPKYSQTDELVGAEGLLRWHHPTRGWIAPPEFVAIAEQSRLGDDLNTWVVRQACEIIASWIDHGLKAVPLAINVSSKEFVTARIVETLAEETRNAGIPAKLIDVEITESVLLRDLDAVADCLNALHSQGHKVALDDFGTGYSSLQYLQRLSIDTLKIDRSFVDQVESQPDQAAICNAIVALANSLDMNTVAEGVENRMQRDSLMQMGCQQFQGFYYSPAIPPVKFAELLKPVA